MIIILRKKKKERRSFNETTNKTGKQINIGGFSMLNKSLTKLVFAIVAIIISLVVIGQLLNSIHSTILTVALAAIIYYNS